MATDSFDRADAGTLGANWTSCGSNPAYGIVSNTAASSNAEAEEAVFWNAETFADNHYSEVTVSTTASNAYIGVAVRCSTGSGGNYYGFYGDNATRYIVRVVAGAYTSLATTGTGFTNGDTLRLEAEGPTLRAYTNGVLWTSVTDSNLTSGAPGLTSWANNNSGRLNDWVGLNLFNFVPRMTLMGAG